MTEIFLLPGGGAAARVPDGTMVLAERGAPLNLHILSLWEDPADDEANIAWTRALGAAMKPFATGRVYVNFIGDEGHDRVVASFGRDGYARLQALKDRYDPENLFASNQNVGRAGSVAHRREVEPVRRRGDAALLARAARQQALEVRARCGGRRRPRASSRRGPGSCGA